MTIEEFGKQIKVKYPQYNDLDDADIGQKMLIKYPQYQNLISTEISPQQKAWEEGKALLGGVAKVGEFMGQEGLGKGIAGVIAQPYIEKLTAESQAGLNKANQLLLQQLHQATQRGDTKTVDRITKLLQQKIPGITPMEVVTKELPTTKQVIASATQTAAIIGTAGLAPAQTAIGRIGQAVEIGTGFGAIKGFEQGQNWSDTLKQMGIQSVIGGVVGGAVGGLIEVGRIAIRNLPKLLSYTSDLPEGAIQQGVERPSQVGKLVGKITPQETLNISQQAVRDLRKEISQNYQEGVDFIADKFGGQRIGLNTNEMNLLNKVVDRFGIDIPQNLTNMSAKETLDLLKNINELYDKRIVRESAEGIIVRKFKDLFKTKTIEFFGGKEGAYSTLLKNYAGEKGVLDAMDSLVRAYQTGNPIAQKSALSRIQSVFNENAPAYLKAVMDFEKRTGTDILDALAAEKVGGWIPAKSGKFSFDEIFRAILLPVTSPKLIGIETRTLGRMINMAKQSGLEQPLKTLLLNMIIGAKGQIGQPFEITKTIQ